MEDNNPQTLQSKLSRTSAYLLGLAQVKGNTLQQQIFLLLSSKYSLNEVKKLLKTGDYIIETLYSVLAEAGLQRTLAVIKRVFQSNNRLCNHLIQTLQANSGSSSQICKKSIKKMVSDQQTKQQLTMTQQITKTINKKKLGGIYLYNQDYKRNVDIQQNSRNDTNFQKTNQLEKQKQVNEKDFKKNLFQKLKNQLKQVQEDLYSPFPDQISTFIIFERKFLETFNHLSYAQDIQTMVNYLQNSNVTALQFLNKTGDMTEQISKFKVEIQMLVSDAKNKNQQRNQSISQKFEIILDKFIKKRAQIYYKTSEKLKQYVKLKKQRQQSKISIGTETLQKQFQTVKNLQKQLTSMQQKFSFITQQKDRAFKSLIQRADNQKHTLQVQLAQAKTIQKSLGQQINEMKKQYNKLIQAIYQRKKNNKSIQVSQKSIYSKKKIVAQSEILQEYQKDKPHSQYKGSQNIIYSSDKKKKQSKVIRLSNIQKVLNESIFAEENCINLSKDKVKFAEIAQDREQDQFLSQKKMKYQQVLKNLNISHQFQPEYKKLRRMPNNHLSMKSLTRTHHNISTARQQKSVQFKTSRTQKEINLDKLILKQQTKSSRMSKNLKIYQKKQIKNNISKSSLNQLSSYIKTPQQTSIKTLKQIQTNKEIPKYDKIKNKFVKNAKQIQIKSSQQNLIPKLGNFNKKKQLYQQANQNKRQLEQKSNYNLDKLKTSPNEKKINILPYLHRSKNKSLIEKLDKKTLQKSSFSYKSQLQQNFMCQKVFDISFNNGNLIEFKVWGQNKCDKGQNQIKKTEKDIQGHSLHTQIIRQLKMYDKICQKKDVNSFYFQNVHDNKQAPIHRKYLKSLHLYKQKSHSSQVCYQGESISDFILRVKSLMKNSMDQKIEDNKIVLNNKQLIKKLLMEGIKGRKQNQSLSIYTKKQQQNFYSKQTRIKNKQNGQKLRKTRKKKQLFDNGYRQIKQSCPIQNQKLPEIIVKPIF